MKLIEANWPAPENIVAGTTTRLGGVSSAPYNSFNMGDHVDDEPDNVNANRKALDDSLPGKKQWQWLEQVHGVELVEADVTKKQIADACFTREAGVVCTVMTADCLPVLLCDKSGRQVAAVHCGWRSLAADILAVSCKGFEYQNEALMAWLGPAIGPAAFEVGEDVRQAFSSTMTAEQIEASFQAKTDGKYLANLYQLATFKLNALGVTDVFGESYCTFDDETHFFSYRRDGVTGRMASYIYMKG